MSYQNLVSFGLTDALDVKQLLFGRVGHCLDGVETCILQLLDVTGTYSTLLHVKTMEQTFVGFVGFTPGASNTVKVMALELSLQLIVMQLLFNGFI